MEKLSLEKFREYCKFTQEIYEIIRDEEKMNSMTEEDAEKLQEELTEKYPNCEVTVLDGGQPVYYYIISME